MAQSPEEMSFAGRLFMGGIFAVAGLMIEAVAFGVIAVDPASVHAPTWVLAMAGGIFLVPGLWILSAGTAAGPVFTKLVGPVVLVGMLAMLHWVAFGPGVRQCSGGISIPFLSARGPVGDLECRLAFGYGALLFDGLVAGMLLSAFAKKKLEGRALHVVEGVANVLIVVPLLPVFVVLAVVSLSKAGIDKLRGTGGDS